MFTKHALPEPQSSLTRRSFLAKSALTAASIAGAGSLLDACGSSSSSGSTAKTTVSIMLFADSELSKAEITAFEAANPDITVNLVPYDAAKLSAMYASGSPPDLVRVTAATDMPGIAARGLAVDLTSRYQASSVFGNGNLLPVNNVFQWDGKAQGQGPRYGSVIDWSQDMTIWYNKTIFDQLHVPYPSDTTPMTNEELLALAKRVTVRQGGKLQVLGLNMFLEAFWYGQVVQALAQQGKSLFSSDFTKADFTTPEAKAILQWYVDLAQTHVGDTPLDPQQDWGNTSFPANRVAMMCAGYWFGGHIVKPDPVLGVGNKVGLAPTPQWGSTRISACASATGLYMASQTKHPDAAWKLLEFVSGGKGSALHVADGSGMPGVKSNFSALPIAQPWQQQAFNTVKNELNYTVVLKFTPYATTGAIINAMFQTMTPVMKGSISLDQGATNLTNSVNLLISQGQSVIG